MSGTSLWMALMRRWLILLMNRPGWWLRITSHTSSRSRMLCFPLHHAADNELHQAQLVGNELARLYAAATASLLKISNTASRSGTRHWLSRTDHTPQPGPGYYCCKWGMPPCWPNWPASPWLQIFAAATLPQVDRARPLVPAFHDKVLRHPSDAPRHRQYRRHQQPD